MARETLTVGKLKIIRRSILPKGTPVIFEHLDREGNRREVLDESGAIERLLLAIKHGATEEAPGT